MCRKYLLPIVLTCLLISACQDADRAPAVTAAPPDAHRPALPTEGQLARERAAALESGAIVPAQSPQLETVTPATPVRRPAPPIQPPADAIQADILVVNDQVITAAEVLYPHWQELRELRAKYQPQAFRDRALQMLRRETQRSVGALLVYAEAMHSLVDEQRQMLDLAVTKEVDQHIDQDFGGSRARLEAHLKEYGLTPDQYRALLRREMVVQQYSREKLLPKVQVRRDELLAFYRRHHDRYSQPETRELLMIELPFARFLPEGRSWSSASANDQAQAKLTALRRAREAHAALAERPFAEVAEEYSVGPHAHTGGSWGMIGRPLQPPLDEVSRLIFEYAPGQYSEPIETSQGWYIAGLGKLQTAEEQSFADVQDDIRRELMEERFARYSTDYILGLADKATISSLDAFVAAALDKAERLTATGPAASQP